ncbi:hypothetical protein EVAR_47451_1 [Eumeta japonica]|uniref:Uncharacterized protein n=1 Tax=Eumeta variegata TaxID=151549 RepID=A0A4C1XBY7_EUMVA|nr:hypothetical protein EVAR_47451_1 [Eumeta japonica]
MCTRGERSPSPRHDNWRREHAKQDRLLRRTSITAAAIWRWVSARPAHVGAGGAVCRRPRETHPKTNTGTGRTSTYEIQIRIAYLNKHITLVSDVCDVTSLFISAPGPPVLRVARHL